MNLKLGTMTDNRATLYFDDKSKGVITIKGSNALVVARTIRDAVNRGVKFDALVAALTPFQSTEYGNRIIESLDQREFRDFDKTEARLRTLINYVDATLAVVRELYC